MKKVNVGDSIRIDNNRTGIIEDYTDTSMTVRDNYGNIIEVAIEQTEPCENVELNEARLLILALKTTNVNLKTLHRNLKEGNWFEIHELLQNYYHTIDFYEDAITEALLALGVYDVGINESKDILNPRDFNERDALGYAKNMFDNLLNLLTKVRDIYNLPAAVCAIFDDAERWLFTESQYKLSHYFGEKK